MTPRDLRFVALFSLAAGSGFAVVGCNDLSEFKTNESSVFRGEVVGSDSEPEQSSFIRKGFPSHTHMELQFDPYATSVNTEDAGKPASEPGRVHTYVCPADDMNCDSRDGTAGPFDHAPLEPIENLTHDALSQYTFPGFGRLRNYIYTLRFTTSGDDGAAVDRNAMVFVSLMDTGKVEVRAISPSVLAEDGQTERFSALFGVFLLDRQSK